MTESGAETSSGPDARTSQIDPTVLGVSLCLVVVFCIIGAIWPRQIGGAGSAALDWLVGNMGWLFVLTSTGFVVFALVLAFSRYGRIPLSQDGEAPECSTVSWVAMMFSAGMGIGLIFFGVREPVAHFTETPPGSGVAPGTPEADCRPGLPEVPSARPPAKPRGRLSQAGIPGRGVRRASPWGR